MKWNCETHGKHTCYCGVGVGQVVLRNRVELSLDALGRHYVRNQRKGDARLAQRVVAELRRQGLTALADDLKTVLVSGDAAKDAEEA